MQTEKKFYTIRELAKIGPLTEHALRLLIKSDSPPPHILINKKVLINYGLFLEWLDSESQRTAHIVNNEP